MASIHHPSSLAVTPSNLSHFFVYLGLDVFNTGNLLTETSRRHGLIACHERPLETTKLRIYNTAVLQAISTSYTMFNSGSSKLLEDNLNCDVFHIPFRPFHTWLNALCEKGLKSNPSCAWSQLNVTSCTNLITTLPESSISLTHHLQTGDDLAADHLSAGRILSSRTSSRGIWHWMMFQHSAKAIRARGKTWLLWLQYLHGMRFSSSLV